MKLYHFKYIFIILVFFITLFILPNFCKASFDFEFNDTTYSLPDLPSVVSSKSNYFITFINNGRIFLYYTDDDSFIYAERDFRSCYYFRTQSGSSFYYYKLSSIDDISWVSGESTQNAPYTDVSYPIFYRSDIYNNSSCDTVLFQGAPMPEPEIPETVEIPVITATEQIPTAIIQTLMIVLPVGLVLLGICLVVYLIPLVVYQ